MAPVGNVGCARQGVHRRSPCDWKTNQATQSSNPVCVWSEVEQWGHLRPMPLGLATMSCGEFLRALTNAVQDIHGKMVYHLPRLVVFNLVELVKCFVKDHDRVSDEVAIIWLSVPRNRPLRCWLADTILDQAH